MPLCVWRPVSRGNTGKAVNTYTDGPVTCHVDKQGQMREMDNREQIDLPQALQWPAKLRGGGVLKECVLSSSNLRTARG